MGTYDTYKTDSKLEEEGTWVTMGDNSRVKIRRLSSNIARKAYDTAQKPFQGVIRAANARGRQLPRDVDRTIVRDTLLNGVITEWEGTTNVEGVVTPFSNKLEAEKILIDLPDYAAEIWTAANDLDNFKKVSMEEAAKNSDAG